MQLSVHRVIWGRGVDPGQTIDIDDGRVFYVDRSERYLDENGATAIKLIGYYTNAPSRRTSIETTPEAEFAISPSPQQLRAIWDQLLRAVRDAIETWEADEDEAAPWRTFTDGDGLGIEITVSAQRFMVRLIEQEDGTGKAVTDE